MISLDYFLVPAGLFVLGIYHIWLFITVLHNPIRTVIGLNAYTREQWVFSLMTDPLKNGVLIVQTLRNNIMASTLLSTAAITLCSVIVVFVSSESSFDSTVSVNSVYYNYTPSLSSIKYLCIMLCFLVAFLCNIQSTRYYAHVSFLGTVPTWKDKTGFIDYVAATLNRGYYFWALGLRAFYLSVPLFLWVFGPIPMFVSCCVMAVVLYFLDTTSIFAQLVHSHLNEEEAKTDDVEAISQSLSNSGRENFQLRDPLLTRSG
ncbi:uncharacterized protein LOC126793620 [Argentina anserina]|uniref:uncharacterized protein LOC126793620 n=1 Tax=Argentina anserina TaxID=57926 RepID=UPI0021762FF3|nr:uncharacterized protein LOC126793620 [Potentilla anserina]XP_050376150.1 uncharacterized protein LOC126793620 [Potentilla anserina]